VKSLEDGGITFETTSLTTETEIQTVNPLRMAKFCLATQYRDPATSRLIITVVLGSKNKEKRSSDTRAVVKWEMARGNLKS